MKMNHQQLLESLRQRLNKLCYNHNGCLIWKGCVNERGYGVISFGRKGGNLLTHRASWFIHYGSFPKDLVLHTCDVRNCININHLKEGTNQDNTDDMMRKKRHRILTHHKGSKNGNSILNEELVIKIKLLLKGGKRVTEISKILQQPPARIYDIKWERTWKHILSKE